MLRLILKTGKSGAISIVPLRTNALAATSARVMASQSRFLTEKLVKTPPMADSITEGTLTKWHKSIGEYIARDEPIATIETDKVDVTVNSAESGTVLEFFAKEGDNVLVGSNLFKVDLDGIAGAVSASITVAAAAISAVASPSPTTTIVSSLPAVGEYVTRDEPIATIETDKVDVTVNSAETGVILELYAKSGDTLAVGSNLFKVNTNGSANSAAPKSPSGPVVAATVVAPVAASVAAQTSTIAPKGTAAPVLTAVAIDDSLRTPVGSRFERRVKMTRMRKTISSRLKDSQNTAASLTTFNEIDMSALMEFRKAYKDAVLEKHGVKIGFMGAFIKASAQALKEVPEVNARIEGDEVVYSDFVDISIAVATPKGLVTPVLRNCENWNIVETEKAMAELGKKAKANAITIEDLAGGTFTISNGGTFGSLFGTPIINQPQSAILGMHAVKDRVVAVNGKVEVRPMMYVALTYDHRLIDGREAVTFLVRVKELIEDPRRLLLEI
ncbi:2-oxoglutarate dehydrogenase complex E2 component [Physocladia obscura]|uniref:dihydrolipoyllysine-residue succinyltransferase n=1 Tax=Physocladia obscura TaxID=109957 RepID=A0AAD5T222_9FUNG|nr:2-oxoglutarate dehydrogenase complex E2 component [Physocladia obscura]